MAQTHAATTSLVGQIASYDHDAMLAALSMPTATPAEIAARSAAIGSARAQLAATSNKSLTPEVVARVDLLLGLPATEPGRDVWR